MSLSSFFIIQSSFASHIIFTFDQSFQIISSFIFSKFLLSIEIFFMFILFLSFSKLSFILLFSLSFSITFISKSSHFLKGILSEKGLCQDEFFINISCDSSTLLTFISFL
jgi:hypothetical protein